MKNSSYDILNASHDLPLLDYSGTYSQSIMGDEMTMIRDKSDGIVSQPNHCIQKK